MCIRDSLDTPGHEDFSEDTYRTLMAVDAAVMVVDSAKGIEAQTKKLFEVVKHRGIPVFTFMNKLDRDGREPVSYTHLQKSRFYLYLFFITLIKNTYYPNNLTGGRKMCIRDSILSQWLLS